MNKRAKPDITKDERIKFIEQIIQSNIKYIQNDQKDIDLLNFPDINNIRGSRTVFCTTKCSKTQLMSFLRQFGEYESLRYKNKYEITFKNIKDADLCAISSNSSFVFSKLLIFTSFEILKDLCIKKNILIKGPINSNLPLDYYKIIIGPISNEYKKELIDSIDNISQLFGCKECHDNSYISFLFKDRVMVERIVEVLSKVKIKNQKNFIVKFAYENCIITDIPEIFNQPFISSLEPTTVVFLFNADIIESFINDKFPKYNFNIKKLDYMVLIKCETLKISKTLYEVFGGLKINGFTIISGYFPEFNFNIGDF